MVKNYPIHIRIPYNQLSQYYDTAVNHNLNVELYLSSEDLDNTPEDRFIEWSSTFLEKGSDITIHAPFMDLSPGGSDSKIRRASFDRIIQLLDIAKIFNPKMIVVHPGFDHWRNQGAIKTWLSSSSLFWKETLSYSKDWDCRLAIENVFERNPESLRKLIESIDSPRVGFCFDTGHFNLFSTSPLEDWLKELGPYFFETHLHDNKGDQDSHFALGEGNFHFEEYFGLLANLPKDLILTFESHTEESVLASIKYFKNRFMTPLFGKNRFLNHEET